MKSKLNQIIRLNVKGLECHPEQACAERSRSIEGCISYNFCEEAIIENGYASTGSARRTERFGAKILSHIEID